MPTSDEEPPLFNEPQFNRSLPIDTIGSDPNIEVRYCHTLWESCGNWSRVGPAEGRAPYQLRADWQVTRCVGGSALEATGSVTNGQGTVTIGRTAAGVRYFDGNTQLTVPEDGTVPRGATRVEGIPVTVSIGKWGLNDASTTMSATCDPNRLEPDPGDDETTPPPAEGQG
jgi:hypothetical protein